LSLASRVAAFLRAREPTSDAWAIEFEEAGEGFARIRMRVTAQLLNGHGNAHGGVIFAFADTAFGYACNSRNELTVGAQASIVYVRAASDGDVLLAEAREVERSGRSGVYDVQVRTEEGQVIALFRGYSRGLCRPLMQEGDAD
jgi:acyl-CoA thioesterase